ncbi:MAG: aspartate aminotransferase [Deltaproteobacteria bacterium RIFOXYD12_FULL_50_9]|nr:MAG: aspartate aminotransferase [Deltaproteobacteria bacterium RIFOXYD12_FULL_50_9]
MAISKKMQELSQRSSWIRRMFEEGAKLKALYGPENVCDFSLGNPDVPPPPEFYTVLEQLALERTPGRHGYMSNAGFPEVREAVARRIAAEQGKLVSRDDVLMTCGAAGGLNVVLKAILDPGDEVIVLSPYFVEYHFYIDNHGGIPVVVPTAADFTLDLAAIAKALTPRTKAIIINSPNNPTGRIYSRDSLVGLAETLAAAGKRFSTTIFLISDEPYRKIVYDNNSVPAVFELYAESLVVSSHSKDLSLPGERIGYIAVHPEIAYKDQLLAAMTLANRILGFVNAPALMQRLVGRLSGAVVDNRIYADRRDLLCRILLEIGYEFTPPQGAFYIFPKSPITDDAEFVNLLLENRILAVPGRGFGAPGYFRLAFCVDEKVIERSATGFRAAFNKAGKS